MVETFYKPLLPASDEIKDMFVQLHEDILKLCQKMLFTQSNLDLASTMVILFRVDNKLDDKDIRRKCKQLEDYSTADFGLSEHLQLSVNV